MTVRAGTLSSSIATITPAGDLLTGDMARFEGSIFGAYTQAFRNRAINGPKSGNGLASPEPHHEFSATLHEMGGQELWEKIIVTPRAKDCGYVLADVNWQTNIWNTHRNAFHSLIRVDIVDSGNVAVDNPQGYPLKFAPLQGHDLPTTVPKDGDATINAIVTFVVPGETGADMLITGSRIVIFGADPDWSEPVKETTQYLTDILVGYSAAEQRIALRKNPRTRLEYQVLPTDGKTSAALEAFIYGWQGRIFGIPFWPDAWKLAQAAPAGTTVINCDTAGRKFAAGGLVVLWRDMFTSEAATIKSVAAGSITLTAPLNLGWAADGLTYAIPALIGCWEGDAELARLSNRISEFMVAFQCDGAADVAAAAPTQVYGYDVLTIEPNMLAERAYAYSRVVQLLDNATGKTHIVDRASVGIGQARGFLWTMTSRAEVAAFRAWNALRRGRHVPFWMPSWQHDLVQAATLAAGNTNLLVEKTGYTRYQYPKPARRYLCITMLDGSGTRYYRKVTNAVEGETMETITLDSALGAASIAPGSCMISFMVLMRLANDEAELLWHSRNVAETQLEFVEVPREVSA